MPSMTTAEYIAYLGRTGKRPDALVPADAEGRESKLHEAIIGHCKAMGWIAFHGSTAHRTYRTVGEADMTIIADRSRVFFVELKSATGKLRPEQSALIAWAAKLGTTIHVVRSVAQFREIVK